MSTNAFDSLKAFLDQDHGDQEPKVKSTASTFTVSFESDGEPIAYEEADPEIEQIDEDIYDSDDVAMVVEGENEEALFAAESVSEDHEIAYEEPEFIPHIKTEIEAEPHYLASLSEKKYSCDCGAESLTLAELQKHSNNHKRKSLRSNMSCCGVDFRDPKSFDIHEKAHENFKAIAPHLPNYSCDDCRKMFSHEEDLAVHLSAHENEDEFMVGSLIDHTSAFADHMLKPIVMPDDPEIDDERGDIFSCGHCNKKLVVRDLKVHLLLFHTLNVFCPLDSRCFEGAKQVRLFSEHIRNKHPDIYKTNNLFNCRHCNQNFPTNFEKLAHMKMCDSKLFVCEEHCQKRFATDWLLKNHMKMVMGEERFSCEDCGKRCVSRSDLQIHNRSHTGERPFACPTCHKSFKTSANRSSHMDIHETEKRHECVTCGKSDQPRIKVFH